MAPFRQVVSLAAALALLAILVLPATGEGAEIRLTTANDFLTHNARPDDLYTFGLHLDFEVRGFDLTVGENAFTDREAGLRFDETELRLGHTLAAVGGWHPSLAFGVVRVGHGFLGQEVQNDLHDLLGDEQLHLDYVGEDYHPFAGVALERPLPTWGQLASGVRIEAEASFGFKTDAAAVWVAAFPLGRHLEVDAAVGLRFADSELPALDRNLAELGPTAAVTVVVRERLDLTWSYNWFGTEQQHFALGYRLPLGSDGAAGGR